MTSKKLACIILAAGKGTRMKSALPKPLHEIAGRAMVSHVVASCEALNPDKIVVVIGPDMQQVAENVKPHATAIQQVANGTGGAALAAREHFRNFDGDILVVFSDTPLVTTETMQRMVDLRRQIPAIGLTYSAFRPADPGKYGRMVMDDDGTLKKIIEWKDATEEQRKITLCNGGIVCGDGTKLFDWLSQVGNDNAQKEYYLTDLPPIARKDNRTTHVVEISEEETAGVNSREDLANLERLMQKRLRKLHMANGATLVDPDSVFFCHDTVVGQDVTIEPNVFFGPDVSIGNGAVIHAYSHIEGAQIGANAEIGPFARLRPGTKLHEKTVIGNFVEIKNTTLSPGAKAKHLTYLGDADVGEKSNIGAGSITCNYDGFMKYRTVIGKDVFIGSNTILLPPLTVGDGAITAAGTILSQDVPSDALAISRTPQVNKDGWAPKFKELKKAQKAEKEKKNK
jgi:bifunctional UDP-N-acetylglucosamine pyrophosphorylase/glucosamine-1-phosphate N-acetyltransferase